MKRGAAVPLLPKDKGEMPSGRKPNVGYRPPLDQWEYIERIRKESGWDLTRVMTYLVDVARHVDESLGAADAKKVSELADANRLTIGQQIGALAKAALSEKKK